MDVMKGKMDQLLEIMIALARKEDNPQVVVDARNIAFQFGFSSLRIPEATDPEFGLPQGYTTTKGVVIPPPVRIPVVNLVAQEYFVASVRQGSHYDDEDLRYAYFMSTQAAHPVILIIEPLVNPADERLRALEDKFKAMEVQNTPGFDIVYMCMMPDLVIP